MKVYEMAEICGFQIVHAEPDRPYKRVYCCDLLSEAMVCAPEEGAWLTVLGHRNVIAVAGLTRTSAVILCGGHDYDEAAIAAAQGVVTLLRSPEPVYETAMKVGALLK